MGELYLCYHDSMKAVEPTAYLQERPTPSDPKLKFRNVSFNGSLEKGDKPLYTLEQFFEMFGIDNAASKARLFDWLCDRRYMPGSTTHQVDGELLPEWDELFARSAVVMLNVGTPHQKENARRYIAKHEQKFMEVFGSLVK